MTGDMDITNWQPEQEGEQVEGTLLYQTSIPTSFGDMEIAVLQGEGGKWRVKVNSNLKHSLAQCQDGDYLRITYWGEKKNEKTGRFFKAFFVERAEAEVPF